MAGFNFPLPLGAGSTGQQAAFQPPFFLRIGVPSTVQQAGLFLPFGFKVGPGDFEEEKPDGAGGRKHVLVYPKWEEKPVPVELEETTIEFQGAEVTLELPKSPPKPVQLNVIPASFEDDRELIELARLHEQLRYQQLLDAIREEEARMMEELTLLMLFYSIFYFTNGKF